MEKRFWLGVTILTLFLVLSLGTVWVMRSIHDPAQADLRAAVSAAQDGNYEQASVFAGRAYRRWYLYRNYTACVADHGPMDDVETLFAEMRVYAREQDPHFTACCAQLEILLQAIADAHTPTWWNFL